jgi:hypothetical protein
MCAQARIAGRASADEYETMSKRDPRFKLAVWGVWVKSERETHDPLVLAAMARGIPIYVDGRLLAVENGEIKPTAVKPGATNS